VSLVSGAVKLMSKVADLYGRNQLLGLGEDRALAKLAKEANRKQDDAKQAGDSVDAMSDADVDDELRKDYRAD